MRRAPVILELDLTDGVVERGGFDPLGRVLGRHRVVLRDTLAALRLAEHDRRVAGLVVRLGGHPLGLATAQELREGVYRLRRAGRWVLAWAESFGELRGGTSGYYVATAAEEVWLQPSGDVGLVGVAAEVTFVRDALGKAGIEVQVGRRHEYKNAANVFTEDRFTPEHREATARLVESAYGQVADGLAERPGVSRAAARAAVGEGPYDAREAHERGLVDRVGYRDEVYDEARRRAGEDAELMFLDRYRRHRQRAGAPRRVVRHGEPVIAVVDVVGGIRLGRGGHGPLGGPAAGADTVTAALRTAAADRHVRAVVLRVNSPGGSYVASDAIWRAVVVTRGAGKPVVVSMGDYAASGGYFVAAPADVIVALPGTLTGSIGVFGGKAVVEPLLERLGVSTDAVSEGARARMFSSRRRYTDDEWGRVSRWLDQVYDDFTAKVADGRGLPRERVHELARGRVWTGADARDRGLVDRMGGLDAAVAVARERAGLGRDEGRVVAVPHVSPLARLRPPVSSEDPAAALPGLREEAWGPLAAAAARLGLPAAGPLAVPLRLRLG